jgi:hypothetical protein
VLFGAYTSTSIKSAALCKKVADGTIGPLPRSNVDSTMPMCLAWHTKGLCNSNCPCACDHVVYSMTEYAPMVKWCKDEGYKSECHLGVGFRGLTHIEHQSHLSLPPTTLSPPPLLSSPAPLPHCLPTVHSYVQQPIERRAPPPASLPSKRGSFDLAQLPSDLFELIAHDTALLQRLGWRGLVAHRRPSSNFASLDNLHHPASRLLRLYAHSGALVKFAMPLWNCQHLQRALSRGPHCSSLEYIDFLQEEFVDMINKGQWVILPAKAVLHLPGL